MGLTVPTSRSFAARPPRGVRRRSFPGPGTGGRGVRILVTLAELVEAIGSVTTDPAEQVLVLDHILRTRRVARGLRGVPIEEPRS